eukprot:GHVN01082230.1.p1 GENE.GHVN01082230.1~~GHVN01082230.1.p1  ORF type:complete len:204 (+),score=65.34 GHVN01082230.1:38-613(+)
MAKGLDTHGVMLLFLEAHLRQVAAEYESIGQGRAVARSELIFILNMSPQEAELLKQRFIWLRDHLTPSHFMSMQQLLKQQTCEVLLSGEGSSWQREAEMDEGGDREEEEDADGGANERSPTTGSEGDDESHIMVLEGIHAITTNTSQSTRLKLYAAGGVYAVSSRIMVTDMLTKRLPPESINGLFVSHAHR